jgi:hypothetical protein
MINSLKGKYDLDEGYNTVAARLIRPVTGDIPLAIVGGMRAPWIKCRRPSQTMMQI